MNSLKIGVFDLMSFFWTLAGARSKEEGAQGLALAVLRYMCGAAERMQLDAVTFGADGRGPSFRTRYCPAYKGDRKAKDPEQRAELDALFDALHDAGFPVVCEQENAQNDEKAFWFEGDDGCASLAMKVRDGGHVACIFSNDWDVAQLLPSASLVPGESGVRLFTTRGEERTGADVEREFGVSAFKLGDLKALAGDGDGYKPFPGEKPGSPGIGDKTAAQLVKHFGSAKGALAAALSNLDEEFKTAGLPPRVPKLLRAGGEKALEMGLACALLRMDVPVPESIDVGDWEEAEELLRMREAKLTQEEGLRSAKAREAEATAAHEKLLASAPPSIVTRIEEVADEILSVSRSGAPHIGEYGGAGAVPDLLGRQRDLDGAGMGALPRDGVEHDPDDHVGTPHMDLPPVLETRGERAERVLMEAGAFGFPADPEGSRSALPRTAQGREVDRGYDDMLGVLDHGRGEAVLLTPEEYFALGPIALAVEWLTPTLPEEAREPVAAACAAARGMRPMRGGCAYVGGASVAALEGFERLSDAGRVGHSSAGGFRRGRDAATPLHAALAVIGISTVGLACYGNAVVRMGS